MKKLSFILFTALFFHNCEKQAFDPAGLNDGAVYPEAAWQEAPFPGALGWSAPKLREAKNLSLRLGSDAVFIVDRGVVVDKWGDVDKNEIVRSVRKSFLSGLYGIFVEKGIIDLQATVDSLGIDDLHGLTSVEKTATVEQLLQSRSGVYHTAAAQSDRAKSLRPERGSYSPGEFFYYNNWDFNALGTIFIQLTGEDVFQAIAERFATPLQMQDFSAENTLYYYERDQSIHPAYHFEMSARDLARFGLLYLRNGRWNDAQIIPSSWIERSFVPYSDAGPEWGYGYMWWIAKPSEFLHYEMAAARGGSGHALYIFPEIETIIVHRAEWSKTWAEVNQIIRCILLAKQAN